MDNSEVTMQDLVQQRHDSRAKAELVEPTDEAIEKEEDVSPAEEMEQEVEKLEAHIDEPEEEAEPEPVKENDDELHFDLNGRVISESQILEWEQGNLRQADYTRKTQDVAESRKQLESDREAFKTKSNKLDGFVDQLSVMVGEFNTKDFDGYTLDELRENDPGEYIKQLELQDKRKAKLKEIQAAKADDSMLKQNSNAKEQLQVLADKNGWLDSTGQPTKAYKTDTDAVKVYLDHLGKTEAEQQGLLLSGHGQLYIDQAKVYAKSKGNSAVMKKVRKAPVVSKPGGVQTSSQQNELEIARANHKKYGTVDTGVALRVAKRNAKN